MPYILKSVLVMPQTTDFTDGDREQLTATVPIVEQRECGYVELSWRDDVESAIIAAECVSDPSLNAAHLTKIP